MVPNLSDMILQTSEGLSPIQRAIVLTIAYADVFDYPLSAAEIYRYCGVKASLTSLYAEIQRIGFLSQTGHFYTLPGRESLVPLRASREELSARLWPEAMRYGRAISGLPFVRMVAVTGSLAVNNTESQADIDYFIVTEPGRLWTCRALALGLGRLAARQGLNLCPNYMVTMNALVFPDRTLYAAHEIAQMVPLSGLAVYAEIRRQNAWVGEFLPNADGVPPAPASLKLTGSSPRFRPVFEDVMRTPPGAWIERWEMDRKIRKLSVEQSGSDESVFSADVCKGHDQRHASRTQQVLDSKVSRLLNLTLQPPSSATGKVPDKGTPLRAE